MLFSRVLTFAALASAVPSPYMGSTEVVETRQIGGGPFTQALQSVVTVLSSAIDQYTTAFNAAAGNIAGASSSTILAVIAGLKAVEVAVGTASTALNATITNAAAGLNNTVSTLTQTEVNNISQATKDLATALSKLGPILSVNATQAATGVNTALAAEISALKAVLSPILLPITTLGNALSTISAKLDTQPFVDAYTALKNFFTTIVGQV